MSNAEFDDKAKTWDTPDKIKRAETIANAIRSQIPLSTNMSGFEYGCGTGLLSFALKDDLGALTMADVSEGMLEVLDEKIKNEPAGPMESTKLDLTTDPLPDKTLDIVYTMMTLHHIKGTEQILRQFHNLLNPEGYLCIADLDEEDGSFHGKEVKSVHRGFNRKELAKLARSIGFNTIKFSTAYQMDHENDHGVKGIFPVFLMTAKKAQMG